MLRVEWINRQRDCFLADLREQLYASYVSHTIGVMKASHLYFIQEKQKMLS